MWNAHFQWHAQAYPICILIKNAVVVDRRHFKFKFVIAAFCSSRLLCDYIEWSLVHTECVQMACYECVCVSMNSARDQFWSVSMWPASNTKRKAAKENVCDTSDGNRVMDGKRNWRKTLRSERVKKRRRSTIIRANIHASMMLTTSVCIFLLIRWFLLLSYKFSFDGDYDHKYKCKCNHEYNRDARAAERRLGSKGFTQEGRDRRSFFSFLFWISTILTFLCCNRLCLYVCVCVFTAYSIIRLARTNSDWINQQTWMYLAIVTQGIAKNSTMSLEIVPSVWIE